MHRYLDKHFFCQFIVMESSFQTALASVLHTKVWSSIVFHWEKNWQQTKPTTTTTTNQPTQKTQNKQTREKRPQNQRVSQYFGRAGFGRGHFPPSTSAFNTLHFRASAWPNALTIRLTQLVNAISHAQSSVNNRLTQPFHWSLSTRFPAGSHPTHPRKNTPGDIWPDCWVLCYWCIQGTRAWRHQWWGCQVQSSCSVEHTAAP